MVGNKDSMKKKKRPKKKSHGNLNYKKTKARDSYGDVNINSEDKTKATTSAKASPSLSSSIFGDSSSKSLSSSIFGDTSASTHTNVNSGLDDLFSSSEKFQQTSNDRVRENLTSIMSNDKSNTSAGNNDKANASNEVDLSKTLSREEIIQRRQKRCKSKEAMTLTKSISVQIPDITDACIGTGTYEDHDDEEIHDVKRGMINMLAIQSDSIMRENGVLILDSHSMDHDSDPDRTRTGTGIVSKDIMESLSRQATNIETQICQQLDEENIIYHISNESNRHGQSMDADMDIHSCKSAKNREKEQNHSFQYHEVASRCLGRLDIRYKMDEEPFNQPQVISNEFLLPIVHSLLGKDAKLIYAGLILSFPNSADQPWHQDGTSLFNDVEFPIETSSHLPPYALNIFVPLDDVTAEVGPTEFCVGSHVRSNARDVMDYIENGDDSSAKVIGPLLKSGDALIYDYRVCHRGTQNLTRDKTRPMLYLMYARPWFSEHINFGSTRLFKK